MVKTRIRRFTPLQRIFHVFLMLSFLIQASTGIGRMFIETVWGQWICWVFGGYEASRSVHITVGIIMLGGFLIHIFYLLVKINWKGFPRSLFGPDSLLPRLDDLKEFFQHIAWFFGLRKAPEFDRWGYWEKFDYWAVFWGMVIIGATGLLLAWPIASSRIIPGWGLNVAFWVHRLEAILAMAHVFVIHFFIAHFRRHNFPMDRTMFEGSSDLEAARHERPAWIARLDQEGKLTGMFVAETPLGGRILYYIFGFAGVATGLFLLIGAIVNVSHIHW